MTRPVVGSVAERLYEAVAPLAFDDETQGWVLLHVCEAAGRMLQPIVDVVEGDDDTRPAWANAFDVDTTPAIALPWLAAFVGVQLLPGSSEADQRERIRTTDGFKRGTIGAILGAAQQHLTGEQRVTIRERYEATAASAYVAWKDRVRAEIASHNPTAWWRMDDLRAPTPNTFASDVLALNPVAYWRLGEAAGATTVASEVEGDSWVDLATAASPVGWWRLNADGTEEIAARTMSVVGTLTPSAGALTDDADGGLTGWGTTNYLQRAFDANLNPAGAFTVLAWIKYDGATGSFHTIYDGRTTDGVSGGFMLRIANAGQVAFGLCDGAFSEGGGGSDLTDGAWHLVAGVYDGANRMAYADGVLVSGPTADAYVPNASGFHRIGGNVTFTPTTSGFPSTGVIDEPMVIDAALTAGDLLALYRAGKYGHRRDGVVTSVTFGVDGALLNDDTTAARFTGSSGHGIVAPYEPALNPAAVTVEAWIRPTALTPSVWQRILSSRSGNTGVLWEIIPSGALQMYFGTGSALPGVAVGAPVLGEWNHAVFTHDGTTGKGYLNGVLVASSVNPFVPNASAGFCIGRGDSTVGFIAGDMGEVFVHDAALTEAQIANLAVQGRPVRDEQGNHDAVMIGDLALADGATVGDVDAALHFDGASCLLRPFDPALNAATFSITGKIRRTADTGGSETIIDSRSSTFVGYILYVDSNDKLGLHIGNGAALVAAISTTSIALDTWYRFEATYDGTNARIYINKVLEHTSANVTLSANASGAAAIGARAPAIGALTNWLVADLDELTFHGSDVLTLGESEALYDAWQEAAPPTDAPYNLHVRTYTPDTPDAAAVLAAIRAQKPIGIVLDYAAVDGQDWQDVLTDYESWQAVIDAYPTWQDAIDDIPG